MKNLKNTLLLNVMKTLAFFCVLTTLIVSCKLDSPDDNSAQYSSEFQKMLADNNMDSTNLISNDVYIKFITELDTTDTIRAADNDAVLITYSGYDAAGTLIAATDSATAKQNNTYRPDLVYGPDRVSIKSVVGGFNVGLKNMPKNSKAILVIPSNMAFGNGPVKYDITMHQIIKDFNKYEEQQFEAYKNAIGFNNDSLQPGQDSVRYLLDSTLAYRVIKNGTDSIDWYYNSKAKIVLRAYYCEYDPAFLDKTPPGRQFFPINNVSDTLNYYIENKVSFPITTTINSFVYSMRKSQICEIVTLSQNAYGAEGYLHPYIARFIVPPYTAVHYRLELISEDHSK